MRRPQNGSLALIAAPTVLFGAHLLGGASDPLLAAVFTAAMAILALLTVLGRDSAFAYRYVRTLALPVILGVGLVLLILWSVHPASRDWRPGPLIGGLEVSTLSIDPSATWVELMKLLGLAAAFLVARPLGADRARLQTTARIMVLFGAAWTAWAIALFVIQPHADAHQRLARPFVSPNIAAAWISVSLLYGAFVALEARGRGDRPALVRILAVLVGLLLTTGLVLTGSRSTIAIMVVIGGAALLVTGLARRRTSPTRSALPIAAVGGVGVVVAAAGIDLLQRFARLGVDAIDRWAIVTTYAEAARQSPWFGYGMGSAPRLSRLLLSPQNESAFWSIRAVHNLPVQWWLESGLVGVAIAAAFLISLLAAVFRGLNGRAARHLWPILMVSGLFLAQGMVDYAAQIYSLSLTWAFSLGLAYSASTSDLWRRKARRSVTGRPD